MPLGHALMHQVVSGESSNDPARGAYCQHNPVYPDKSRITQERSESGKRNDEACRHGGAPGLKSGHDQDRQQQVPSPHSKQTCGQAHGYSRRYENPAPVAAGFYLLFEHYHHRSAEEQEKYEKSFYGFFIDKSGQLRSQRSGYPKRDRERKNNAQFQHPAPEIHDCG